LKLKDLTEEVYKCIRCGWCREKVCPIREELGFESTYARGIVLTARGLLEKQLNYSAGLARQMYLCLECANCMEHCPLDVDVIGIMNAMRQDLVKAGLAPELFRQVDLHVESTKNPLGIEREEMVKWSEDLNLPRKGEVLFFVGCYPSYKFPKTARATVRILCQAGIDIAYLAEEEWCCGTAQYIDGSADLAQRLMVHNLEEIENSGAQKVVTTCAGCYTSLKYEYPKRMGELPFEVLHITELLENLINKGKIGFKNKIKKRVTYHDPCHLGRHSGLYDAARKILNHIPGLELVEMPTNRENARCCGGEIVLNTVFPELAKKLPEIRVNEAANLGVKDLITSCPLCVSNLRIPARKRRIKLYDLPLLVAESAGVSGK
jgi:Fe-S oxidoreductase